MQGLGVLYHTISADGPADLVTYIESFLSVQVRQYDSAFIVIVVTTKYDLPVQHDCFRGHHSGKQYLRWLMDRTIYSTIQPDESNHGHLCLGKRCTGPALQ